MRIALVAGWLALVLCAVGCKENEAATAACKEKKTSDDCSACCKDKGASGHKYINGDCGCLG